MKTSLSDLNEYLFAQLDELSNPDLEGDKLKDAIAKTKVIATVAQTVINNANSIQIIIEGIIALS